MYLLLCVVGYRILIDTGITKWRLAITLEMALTFGQVMLHNLVIKGVKARLILPGASIY